MPLCPHLFPPSPSRVALPLFSRPFTQGHAGSRVRVGDYLYYGLGVTPNHEAAADEYRSAADANNAQAMFNLGVMHHLGDGLEQDIHLAKRFYDMALRTSVDAKLPASLALYALYVSFAKEWIELQLLPTLSRVLADAGQGEAPNVDVEDFVRVRWCARAERGARGTKCKAQGVRRGLATL